MKRHSRPHTTNVLELGAGARRLWQFNTGTSKVALARDWAFADDQMLPAKLVAKDWRDLVQPRLNIAWLPSDQVFLRAVSLPASDAAELRSMLELQIEKLSPLPPAQVVWSFEALPKTPDNLQSVVVVIAARSAVEQFLGRIEAQGYFPDRLEVPAVHELISTTVNEDGVWIYPRVGDGRFHCLVAWWYGGVLRDLGVVHVPNDASAAANLRAQIANLAWAGELEGWLTAPPRWHVVATAETAAATAVLWQTDEELQLVEPPPAGALAELAAGKAAAARTESGLLPVEFAARYRQRYVDRLWMRAVAAVIVLYIAGVMIYFGLLGVENYRADKVSSQVAELGVAYTNALRLKAQGEVLQEQFSLRYAALDAWRVVSENLPDGIKLTSFGFSRGKTVSVFGEAPGDAFDKLAAFNSALVRAAATPNGPPFFAKVTPPTSSTSSRPGGSVITWSFTCEMNSAEIP